MTGILQWRMASALSHIAVSDQGQTMYQVARAMHVTPKMARAYLETARENGWCVRRQGVGSSGTLAYRYTITPMGQIWLKEYGDGKA